MLKSTLIVMLLIITTVSHAQYRLTGTVSDAETRTLLSGATIQIDKGQRGVVTDDEGRFAILIPSNPVKLIISHIGYHETDTTVSITSGTALTILLAPKSNVVEEVQVSTGYQILPKDRLTGSFEVVSEKLFNRQISQDIISRLDGLVPGMLFDKRYGNEGAFSIRGLSTISPTIAQPLIIIDDFPYEGDIKNINPNDVESVTILKDAAAASIWGVRAGNGVLVITTKKSKLDKPFSLSANTNLSIQNKPNLYYTPQMTPSDFIDIEQFLFERGFFDADLDNTITWPVITPAVEVMEQKRRGLITEQHAEVMLSALRMNDLRDQLNKHVYQRSAAQQYAIKMDGGNSQVSYYISGGLDKSVAQKKGDEFQRMTLRTQSTFKPISTLQMTAAVVLVNSLRNNNSLPDLRTGTTGSIYPYARLLDDVGQPAIIEQHYRLGFVDTAGQGQLLDWHFRPLAEMDIADHAVRIRDLLVNLSANYKLIPQLDAEVRYQYQNQGTSGRDHNSVESFYSRNLINRFTQISGDNIIRPIPVGGILQLMDNDRSSHNIRGQLTFTNNWTPDYRFIIIAGGELRRATSWSRSHTVYGYDDELLLSFPVDLVNRYPIYGGMGFDSPLGQGSTYTGLDDRFVSIYANTSFTLKEQHIFTASARRDASNLFGVATNNKWKPLWSVGYRLNLSSLPLLYVPWINRLSLRATYGHSGNVNNTIAAVTTIDYRGISPLARNQYAIVVNPPNEDLRWENVSTTNVGLDFGVGNNRFNGSVEYYSKNAMDLISSVPADLTTGFGNLTRNVAEMRTSGWDFNLRSINPSGVLRWTTNLYLSLNRTKIKRYLVNPARASGYISNGASLLPIEGHDAYNIVSYRWGNLDPETGDPRAYALGLLSSDYAHIINNATIDDLVFHGSAMPRAFGSLRNEWGYRGWSISANITYRTGYYFRRPTVDYVGLLNNGVVAHGDYYKRWQKPGDEVFTSVPSMLYPTDSRRDQVYRDSEATVEKGDHIRLQDINLSYRIDNTSVLTLPARAITLIFYARNMPILWRANKSGIDPDVRGLPAPFSFSIGLNLDF